MSEPVIFILTGLVALALILLEVLLFLISVMTFPLRLTVESLIRWKSLLARLYYTKLYRETSSLLSVLVWVLVLCGLALVGAYVWRNVLAMLACPLAISNGLLLAPISFVVGKPRSGKGLLTMRFLIQELRTTQRPIITNFAIKLHPWVNGKGIAQMGLLAYLKREFGQTFNAENRIMLLSDDEMARFFLYRAVPVNGSGKFELQKAAVTKSHRTKEGDVIIDEFDTSLHTNPQTACFIISDEAWKYWGARSWQFTGEGVLFYGAQHGKLGDDWIIATQHTKQVDRALRDVAQDFWQCRNRGYLKMGLFRQPKDIKVYQYENPPTGASQEAMESIKFKVDVGGMAQCYDTTQGVGICGGLAGDMGKAAKGLSWHWIYVFGVVFLVLFWFGLSKGLAFFMGKATPTVTMQNNNNKQQNETTNSEPTDAFSARIAQGFMPRKKSAGDLELPVLRDSSVLAVSNKLPDEVFIVGVGYLGPGRNKLFLSDGRTVQSGDGHLQFFTGDFAVIDGKGYRQGVPRRREPESIPVFTGNTSPSYYVPY